MNVLNVPTVIDLANGGLVCQSSHCNYPATGGNPNAKEYDRDDFAPMPNRFDLPHTPPT